ncbi:ATP synthase F1 subunit delta [candidate division KSB1 bacterium]|nr:ATP synthase F1 subunit delta [candidate division KSB1 bacterium]
MNLIIHPLAKRYAKALWELAEERGQIEAVLQQLGVFEALFQSNQLFRWFLLTPAIGKREKIKIFKNLFATSVSSLCCNFLILLIKKGRQNYLPQLVFEIKRLYDVKQNRLRLKIILPVELDKEEQNQLEQRLKVFFHSDIRLDKTIDKSILGGIVIKIDDTVYDLSLRNQLNNLSRLLKPDKRVF